MDCFIIILELFAGIVMLFALGALAGHFLKLYDFMRNWKK